MSYPLFIQQIDIPRFTALNANTDVDRYVQFCYISQQIHIQGILGSNLFEKISDDITAGTLSGNYLTLVNNFIKQMVIHWAMVEYLPFAAYQISNNGIYKKSSENSETVSKEEVDFLVEKERQIAQHYTDRFVAYMCKNSTLYPEYNNNTEEDMKPDKVAFSTGWVLDETRKIDLFRARDLLENL